MFGLGAPTVPSRALFERMDDTLIQISNYKICHTLILYLVHKSK